MCMPSRLIRVSSFLALALSIAAANAADIRRQPDNSFCFVARTYSATIDADGNFRSLVVAGQEFLNATAPFKGGAFPGDKPAAAVQANANQIIAQRDAIRVEYTFADTGFDVFTEGGSVEWRVAKAVNACIARDGQASPQSVGAADIAKVVAGNAALSLSQPYHIMWGRLLPSHLTRGGKPTDRFKCHIECGVTFDPAELLQIVSLESPGTKPPATPRFAPGQTPHVKLSLQNLGSTEAAAEVRFRVLDHHTRPKTVLEKTAPISAAATRPVAAELDIPLREPGLYWVKAELLKDAKPLKSTQLGLIYDADHYRPELARPPDFKQFWDEKLRQMRTVPFDAKLTESPQNGTDRFAHYDLDIAVSPTKRIHTFLRVPRKPGQYDAEVFTHWGSDTPQKVMASLATQEKQPQGAGMWQRGEDRIRVGAPQPDDSTYTRWNGRDDNNMLDSYLLNVRMADYLRSRPEVKRIWLFGGSRSGASMLTAAALSPERVAAVNVHVPTCCGLSWLDRPYRGLGQATVPNPRRPPRRRLLRSRELRPRPRRPPRARRRLLRRPRPRPRHPCLLQLRRQSPLQAMLDHARRPRLLPANRTTENGDRPLRAPPRGPPMMARRCSISAPRPAARVVAHACLRAGSLEHRQGQGAGTKPTQPQPQSQPPAFGNMRSMLASSRPDAPRPQ